MGTRRFLGTSGGVFGNKDDFFGNKDDFFGNKDGLFGAGGGGVWGAYWCPWGHGRCRRVPPGIETIVLVAAHTPTLDDSLW